MSRGAADTLAQPLAGRQGVMEATEMVNPEQLVWRGVRPDSSMHPNRG